MTWEMMTLLTPKWLDTACNWLSLSHSGMLAVGVHVTAVDMRKISCKKHSRKRWHWRSALSSSRQCQTTFWRPTIYSQTLGFCSCTALAKYVNTSSIPSIFTPRLHTVACYAERCIWSRCPSVRPSVCLSVCLSCAGIVSKWLMLRSCGLHFGIAPWLWFLCDKIHRELPKGTSREWPAAYRALSAPWADCNFAAPKCCEMPNAPDEPHFAVISTPFFHFCRPSWLLPGSVRSLLCYATESGVGKIQFLANKSPYLRNGVR